MTGYESELVRVGDAAESRQAAFLALEPGPEGQLGADAGGVALCQGERQGGHVRTPR